MKHKRNIVKLLLAMFLVSQLIGLFVISSYFPQQEVYINETTGEEQVREITPPIPYGLETPDEKEEYSFAMFIISFIFALLLIFLIMRLNSVWIMRIWFFVVVSITIGIAVNALFLGFRNPILEYVALLIGIGFAYFKIVKRNIPMHNISELLIYPGIAVIFVSFLNIFWIIVLLVIISIYDIIAVWYFGFMQKMAKFQMNNAKIFAGFFVPYIRKEDKLKILKAKKEKSKTQRKIPIEIAVLGGGDVVFPLITAGIVLNVFGLIPALIITFFSTLSLALLFLMSEKGKSYPAMPFLSIGCLFGLLVVQIMNFVGFL